MNTFLTHGIPSENEYRLLINSDYFKSMEGFSNIFLLKYSKYLKHYSKKWVKDSLHQWSRLWEYPFVLTNVQTNLNAKRNTRILDAGSGITFFPFYIKSQYNCVEIYCSDYDKSLGKIFRDINANCEYNVKFINSDLRSLPFKECSFDVIYCISVLEHNYSYREIINEYSRLLKPGGDLIVTFDISLDGVHDIPIEEGAKLLKYIADIFNMNITFNLNSLISKPDIVTTKTALNLNKDLLPWRSPSLIFKIKSLLTGDSLACNHPLLTFYCLGITKSAI